MRLDASKDRATPVSRVTMLLHTVPIALASRTEVRAAGAVRLALLDLTDNSPQIRRSEISADLGSWCGHPRDATCLIDSWFADLDSFTEHLDSEAGSRMNFTARISTRSHLPAKEPWRTRDDANRRTPAREVAGNSVSEEPRRRNRGRVAAIVQGQGLLVMLLLIVFYFVVQSPYFLTWSNALTIGSSSAALGIMAIAQTYLIISGGIDVSAGSVVALSGVTLGILIEKGMSFWPAAVLATLTGAGVGLINALLVVALKINPFIATLGTMSVFSGLAFVLTSGETRVVNNDMLTFIGTENLLGLPVPLVVFLIVLVVAIITERFTAWGRTIYAIGGNLEAARLSGLHVRSTQTILYVLSGASAGLAGVLVTAQLASASPQVGANYLLSVVTAIILGGASLSGGRGTVLGTLVAIVILGVLSDGFALMGSSTSAQTIALGLALIFAVLLDQTTRRLRTRA